MPVVLTESQQRALALEHSGIRIVQRAGAGMIGTQVVPPETTGDTGHGTGAVPGPQAKPGTGPTGTGGTTPPGTGGTTTTTPATPVTDPTAAAIAQLLGSFGGGGGYTTPVPNAIDTTGTGVAPAPAPTPWTTYALLALAAVGVWFAWRQLHKKKGT